MGAKFFLGQHVRKYGDKVLLKPSSKRIQARYQGLRKLVKANLHTDPATLIWLLNSRILGWARYHRHSSSKAAFQKLDSLVFRLLWRWACYRHPQKNAHWLRNRYFRTVGGNHWVFFGRESGKRGESRLVTLAAASSIRLSGLNKSPLTVLP